MTATTRILAVWAVLGLMLLSSLAWAEANGFISENVTDLWAKAIVLIDGPPGFRATDPFYPPIPYVLTLAIQSLTVGTLVPTPFVLSAGLGAVLALLWYYNLRYRSGMGVAAAVISTFLLTANPFFLRAVADGPETILLMIGTWVYARGIVNLRLSGNAPDMMKVSVGLLIAALSHSYGLLICVGALPFLIVAARPSVLVASPWGYIVAMFFPVLTAIGSLLFISAVFNNTLFSVFSRGDSDISEPMHFITLIGLTPIAMVAVFRTVRVPRLFMPLLAAIGTILGAYFLNDIYSIEPDPMIAIAPMLSIIAIAIRFWPPVPTRTLGAIALLMAGFLSSFIAVDAKKSGETHEWFASMTFKQSRSIFPMRGIAAFLENKSNIMVDIERNPEIATALGTAENLLLAGEPAYDQAVQGGRITADYIVTRNPREGELVEDRVLQSFSLLKTDKLLNYKKVFEDVQWYVFEKVAP